MTPPFLKPECVEKAAQAYVIARFGTEEWSKLPDSVRSAICDAIQAALLAILADIVDAVAQVAEDEKLESDTGEESDKAYDLACEHIAAAIRALAPKEKA